MFLQVMNNYTSHLNYSQAYPRDVFPGVSYPSDSKPEDAKPSRKAPRAAQACDSCRTLKAKCDEGRPGCGGCRGKGIECRYRDPPLKQQDKGSADILETLVHQNETLMQQNEALRQMQNSMSEMNGRIEQLHSTLKYPGYAAAADPRLEQKPLDRPPQPLVDYNNADSQAQALRSTETPYATTTPQMGIYGRPDPLQHEQDKEGGDPHPLKAPSIPVNHTTGAARLLLVGPIAAMCNGFTTRGRPINEKYPIIQEEKRGLLRLYERGEGTDASPGYDCDPLDHGADSDSGDTNSDVSSPAGEEWGQLGGLTPPPPDFTRGNIGVEGMPDLSREKVMSLVQSYKANINIMHPILIPGKLDLLVETFLKSTPESQAKSKHLSSVYNAHPPADFVGNSYITNPQSPGNKRKRSLALTEQPELTNWHEIKPGYPFRSISSALVLLVLALGEITQYKGKIPECLPDREHDRSWANTSSLHNWHPHPHFQGSPLLPKAKNLDIIPGLFYFALATDIIGNQLAGNSLQHVHTSILAGLYYGQLARVMESYAYIHQACRSLQIILQPKLDKLRGIKAESGIVPAEDNPLVITFWTCLQLESDIVAELPLPHSGILTYEDDMPNPNLVAANEAGFNPTVIESYAAQLFLRKHLNQLHNMFYKPENKTGGFLLVHAGKEPMRFPTIEACEANLEQVSAYAGRLSWTDADPLATEILGARLRAKYYGAQVITYRNFVLEILKNSANLNQQPGETISSEFKTGIDVPSINSKATQKKDIDPKALEYAQKGIEALIKSTTAFHGLGDPAKDRLIVTNIWGTAHAQWGNMLTLQAAFKDPILHDLINERELRDLLEKTIAFLDLHAHNSSALNIDLRILQHTRMVNNLLPLHPSSNQLPRTK